MSEPNEKKQGQAFIEKRPKKDKNYRLKQLTSTKGIVVVVSVVFGLFVVAYLYGEFRKPVDSYYPCTENTDVVVRASEYIDSNNLEELNKVVDQVNTFNKNEDPTCTAIIFWQKLIERDLASSRELLEELENEYTDSLERDTKDSLFTNNPSVLWNIQNSIEESNNVQEENRRLFNEGAGEIQDEQ